MGAETGGPVPLTRSWGRSGGAGLAGAFALLLVAGSCGGGAPTAGGPAGPPAPEAVRPAGPSDVPVAALDSALDADARAWVERTLASFTLEALAAQLVVEWIPGSYVSPTSPEFEPLRSWVAEERIGGVSPSIGSPLAYAARLNALQRAAEVPLLVASDFENGGPGMRLSGSYALPSMLPQGGGTAFPPTMAFGAIGDERFAYEYGRITAREARAVGVHMLFAPVLDVNSNPDNPVISTRAFGADPELVARLGAAFIRGARDGGALTTGKHFPGHGDTSVDSHVGIPVVDADRARLDTLELVPFRRAIAEGVDGIMTAHVQLPRLLGPGAPPATLAEGVLTGLLREDLGFEGLVLTDALTMRAITDLYGIREASVRSVEAGADVILAPRAVPEVVDAVVEAVRSGRLTRGRLEDSARRILELKARLRLHEARAVALEEVEAVVGSGPHLAFADSAATRSITLVRDAGRLLPLPRPGVVAAAGSGAGGAVAMAGIAGAGAGPARSGGEAAEGPLVHLRYAPSTWLWAGRELDAGLRVRVPGVRTLALDERSDSLAWAAAAAAVDTARAAGGRLLVTAYVPPAAGSGPDALPEALRRLVAEHAASERTVLVSLGNPYLLAALPDVGTYLVAWGDREVSQRAALAALFGEEAIGGRLPVPLPPYPVGHGLERARTAERLVGRGVDDPLVAAGIAAEDAGAPADARTVADAVAVGMDAALGLRLDSLARAAVTDSVASAVTIAVGRHGRLVHLAGYGELAWGSGRPATPTSLFDLASLTKVVGTTTAIMLLVQEGSLDLADPVVRHLPGWARTDARKANVTVRDLLLHRAGLPPFRRWFFELGGAGAYREAVYDEPLLWEPADTTVYSDLGPMTLGWIVEEITGRPLADFLAERVFEPLGMRDTFFRPASDLLPRIAATELDDAWRGELVWGRAHDENADAMGGVAGHAGLFATALDLSVFARMMLNDGLAPACVPGAVVGEPCPVARPEPVPLLDPALIEVFTTRYGPESSRALGWDTPEGRSSAGDYMTASAYGHTGYTGTSLWIDPELDLWVVLLTNRVHPSRENQRHVPFRRAVHDAVVRAILDRPILPRQP